MPSQAGRPLAPTTTSSLCSRLMISALVPLLPLGLYSLQLGELKGGQGGKPGRTSVHALPPLPPWFVCSNLASSIQRTKK